MKAILNYSSEALLAMDPLTLLELLSNEVDFDESNNLNNESSIKASTEMLNKTASYICYFKELETMAKLKKREGKRAKCSNEESDRLLGVEEVMETYKRISETQYDKIVKLMTAKRLSLDEAKVLSTTI
jgi:hypothetical protein